MTETETPKSTHYLPVWDVEDSPTPRDEAYQRATFQDLMGERTVRVSPGTLIPIPEPAPDRKLRVGDRLRATRDNAYSISCEAGDVGTVTALKVSTLIHDVGFSVNSHFECVMRPTVLGAAQAGWELIEPNIESEAQAKLDSLLTELNKFLRMGSTIGRANLREIVDRYRPAPATPAERLRLMLRDYEMAPGARQAILDVAAELERETSE